MPRFRAALATGLALALAAAVPAGANCRILKETGKCIFVPKAARHVPDFAVGDAFPVYKFSMLIDIDRYGLKPVDGAWRYYKSGPDIYRVDATTYRVLEIIQGYRRR
ncbi:MAG: hypothetical protein H6895_09050 [Defluviimonas sp.]|uniref:hypothetical protein n=1 Tax=Albidovulum sp. TaxID=1872424 RepID=UPI001DF4EF0D|nr:hypothetical protein [Paracoccaceae bacterium]MCC0064221.1 hypothetical protein [Defluviimonas sp.]